MECNWIYLYIIIMKYLENLFQHELFTTKLLDDDAISLKIWPCVIFSVVWEYI